MPPQAAPYARRGFVHAFGQFRPSMDATVVPDFYTSMAQSGPTRRRRRLPSVPRSLYASIEHTLDLTRRAAERLGDETRGSNNWVVSGMASANGHALLANDPHLSLTSPSVFWGVHLTITGGPDALDVHGVTFPGIPGVIIGYNNNLAWGVTTADYDVTDAFLETITPGTGGAPDTVLHNGMQVPIETIHEMVPDGLGNTVDVPIEIVPHHGPIYPSIVNHRIAPRTGATAISVRWTGHQATNEFGAFLALAYAHTVEEAMPAIDNFGVGAQNFVVADTTGQIGYSSSCLLPTRPAMALTWSPTNIGGNSPAFVLPGTGEADWTGYVDRQMIPRAIGSATRRYIATSNNDQAGTSMDGNPFNDRVFLASSYDDGFRQQEILTRLQMLNNQAHVTDMTSIQSDHTVLIGGRYRTFIASAMANLEAEWTTPGSHPELATVALSLMPRQARLRDAAARLAAWTLDSPTGTEPTATALQRSDAIATSMFHGWMVRFLDLAFGDEFEALGLGRGAYRNQRMRTALVMLEHPDQLTARDTGGQSVLWDDMSTVPIESRDEIILRALDEALAQLETRFMNADVNTWLWGTVHTLRLESIVPGPGATLSIPPPNDAMFPNGFPRPGGLHVVDACNPGVEDFNFDYGSGPTQRFSVEMDPAGPRAFNGLPGGEIFNAQSPHHADEMNNYWRLNQVHPLPHTEAEVVAAYERHYVFVHP
jgi:penicillin amidase